MKIGRKRLIQAQDRMSLPKHLDPESIPWNEDQVDWSTPKSFYKTYFKVSWVTSKKAVMYQIIGSLFAFCTPIIMHAFISRLQEANFSKESIQQLIWLAIGFGVTAAGYGVTIQHYFVTTIGFFQTATNMINKKIFSHALKLSSGARNKYQVGDIVNYMSSDSEAVADACITVIDLVNAVVLLLGCSALLFYYMGWSALVAVVVMAILVPLTQKLSRRFRHLQDKVMSYRDQRITLMTQVLNAIRIVKYFVWEKSVMAEVGAVRNSEIRTSYTLAKAEIVWGLLYTSVSAVVLFSALLTHALLGKDIDMALIFTAISIFSIMEMHFGGMSRFISRLINISVSSHRIIRFLKSDIVEKNLNIKKDLDFALKIQNLSFRYNKESPKLFDRFDLNLKPGQSLAVIGPVGGGKSTLLNLLLGELHPQEGSLVFDRTTSMGYVPQDAYIINSSLRENIVFGSSNNQEDHLRKALHYSALEFDLAAWPSGLDTEIGEKGVNLSGGQKQRVSLARTILANPELILLDDPLSAVDPNTENFLTEKLLFGLWKNKTRIMATHRLASLERFDQILFLQDGKAQIGSYSKLRKKSKDFENFLLISEQSEKHNQQSVKHAQGSIAGETTTGDTSRLIEEEDRAIGAVENTVYWNYLKALAGVPSGHLEQAMKPKQKVALGILFLTALLVAAMPLLQKVWLSISNRWPNVEPLYIVLIYGGLGLLTMLITFIGSLYWTKKGILAGVTFHNRMLNSVLHAHIRFFDSTPIGRILQRFARDMESVDIYIRWSFDETIHMFFQVALSLFLIIVTLPLVIFFLVPVLWIYYRFQKDYRRVAREIKRLDSIARSPRFAHFKETLQGLSVLRAFEKTDWSMQMFYQKLRYSNEMYFTHYMVNRWFSVRLPMIGAGISLLTALMVVYSASNAWITAGVAGLVTQYANELWKYLNWGVRIFSDLESRMTSVERLNYYASLPSEEKLTNEEQALSEADSNSNSKRQGAELEFKNVSVRYAEHLPMVLKNVSFKINEGSRTGLIGRTGSGKSTIFQTVYRFVDIASGDIFLNGRSIQKMRLDDLRKQLAVIPQDPVLFMGSLRANIDRYSQASDKEIWSVLKKIEMDQFVKSLPNQLEFQLAENGANLSQGQRQLMCLARALLMKVKIIFMDEATASVDVETDALIQKVIRESLEGITLVTIAHRLSTLEGYDQIIELDQGVVIRDELDGKNRSALQPSVE